MVPGDDQEPWLNIRGVRPSIRSAGNYHLRGLPDTFDGLRRRHQRQEDDQSDGANEASHHTLLRLADVLDKSPGER